MWVKRFLSGLNSWPRDGCQPSLFSRRSTGIKGRSVTAECPDRRWTVLLRICFEDDPTSAKSQSCGSGVEESVERRGKFIGHVLTLLMVSWVPVMYESTSGALHMIHARILHLWYKANEEPIESNHSIVHLVIIK